MYNIQIDSKEFNTMRAIVQSEVDRHQRYPHMMKTESYETLNSLNNKLLKEHYNTDDWKRD